jgi:hypothetical protein
MTDTNRAAIPAAISMALAVLLAIGAAASPGRSTGEGRSAAAQSPASAAPAAALDFEFFRTKVQPIFLNHRKGLARCYACHSQGTPFRLQLLPPGSTSWDEQQSRLNFQAASRVVVPGNPVASRLLTMPLAEDAGGVPFHPGGKHWASQRDPEWQLLAAWIRGEK